MSHQHQPIPTAHVDLVQAPLRGLQHPVASVSPSVDPRQPHHRSGGPSVTTGDPARVSPAHPQQLQLQQEQHQHLRRDDSLRPHHQQQHQWRDDRQPQQRWVPAPHDMASAAVPTPHSFPQQQQQQQQPQLSGVSSSQQPGVLWHATCTPTEQQETQELCLTGHGQHPAGPSVLPLPPQPPNCFQQPTPSDQQSNQQPGRQQQQQHHERRQQPCLQRYGPQLQTAPSPFDSSRSQQALLQQQQQQQQQPHLLAGVPLHERNQQQKQQQTPPQAPPQAQSQQQPATTAPNNATGDTQPMSASPATAANPHRQTPLRGRSRRSTPYRGGSFSSAPGSRADSSSSSAVSPSPFASPLSRSHTAAEMSSPKSHLDDSHRSGRHSDDGSRRHSQTHDATSAHHRNRGRAAHATPSRGGGHRRSSSTRLSPYADPGLVGLDGHDRHLTLNGPASHASHENVTTSSSRPFGLPLVGIDQHGARIASPPPPPLDSSGGGYPSVAVSAREIDTVQDVEIGMASNSHVMEDEADAVGGAHDENAPSSCGANSADATAALSPLVQPAAASASSPAPLPTRVHNLDDEGTGTMNPIEAHHTDCIDDRVDGHHHKSRSTSPSGASLSSSPNPVSSSTHTSRSKAEVLTKSKSRSSERASSSANLNNSHGDDHETNHTSGDLPGKCDVLSPHHDDLAPAVPLAAHTRRSSVETQHPCVYQHGRCRFGERCTMQHLPGDTCIHFYRGRCVYSGGCKWKHIAAPDDEHVRRGIDTELNRLREAARVANRHPCLLQRDQTCLFMHRCRFADVPGDVCVMFLRQHCRKGARCEFKHDRSFVRARPAQLPTNQRPEQRPQQQQSQQSQQPRQRQRRRQQDDDEDEE